MQSTAPGSPALTQPARRINEGPPVMRRLSSGWLIALCLAFQTVLLVFNANRCSPTVDEPGHLAAGVSIILTGDFDAYRVNPPLVKVLGGAAALLSGPIPSADIVAQFAESERLPNQRQNLTIGNTLFEDSPRMATSGMLTARLMCLPFAWLGGWVCYQWARRLYGAKAGCLALGLWCVEPLLLGHGCLFTMDMPGAATMVWCGYRFYLWKEKPSWQSTQWFGVALGIALLTKFTVLVLLPCFVAMAAVESIRRHAIRQGIAYSAFACLIAVLVVNLGFGFDRSFRPLGDFLFGSQTLSGLESRSAVGNRFSGTVLHQLQVPLPSAWLSGIDVQKRDFERPWSCFLDGAWRDGGWWYFYFVALIYKLPVGLLLLMATASWAVASGRQPIRVRDELPILVPLFAVLALVSSQTNFTLHVRYAIPILPFIFVWCGRLVVSGDCQTAGCATTSQNRVTDQRFGWVAWLGLLAAATESLATYPESLSFMNLLVRSQDLIAPRLLDSNRDWGQNLKVAADWLVTHRKQETVYLSYFGHYSPSLMGINDFRPIPKATEEDGVIHIPLGLYIVSINHLHGHRLGSPDGLGRFDAVDGATMSFLRMRTPDARIGRTMLVYRVANSLENMTVE